MARSTLVRVANKASASDLAAAANIPETLILKEKSFQLCVARAPTLTAGDRERIWDLYEVNMRALAEKSSFGWDPEKKKKELFHRNSRFILLSHHTESQDDLENPCLAAYTMFRFDDEEGEDVLYCYELQVADTYRNCGIGRLFVDKLVQIARNWRMEKVMLTVLKENTSAKQFYEKVGFILDPMSPEYESSGEEESDEVDGPYDYEILSKAV